MSLEREVKQQFARVFEVSDWTLFKGVGESYLRQATRLRRKHLRGVPDGLRLLARNCQKRLLIGVAVELLVKAAYLRKGYCINMPTARNSPLQFPFTPAQVQTLGEQLSEDETFALARVIDALKEVVSLGGDEAAVLDGFNTAKVYRNKEGHVVARTHGYVPADYRKVESALSLLYRHAFNEILEIRFSLAPRERPLFRITAIPGVSGVSAPS
jgi:hypothetical protein